MNVPVPTGHRQLAVQGGFMVASEAWADWAGQRIRLHGSLENFAQQQPNVRPIRGRGPAYLIDLGTAGTGMVRRLRHGGVLARITADRFLRWGVPRSVNELLTSVRLRDLGIETPEVLVACVYPRLCHYRGEVLRAYQSDTSELATFLFEPGASDEERVQAVAAAAAMTTSLSRAGVCHTDYNAMNLLVRRGSPKLRVLVIDLEKSTRCQPGSRHATWRMRGRLVRSLRKCEARSSRPLPEHAWDVLAETPGGE